MTMQKRAGVRISSQKIDARNGRQRYDFDGNFHSDQFGIIFSGRGLILNLTDGERRWTVILEDDATDKLAARFAGRLSKDAAA